MLLGEGTLGILCSDPRSPYCWVPLRLRGLKWQGDWNGGGNSRLPGQFVLWMVFGISAFRLDYSSATERRQSEWRLWLLVLFTGHSYSQKFRPSSQVSMYKCKVKQWRRILSKLPSLSMAMRRKLFKGWMHRSSNKPGISVKQSH